MSNGDLFLRMCREAMDELASGDKGWRDAQPNTVTMACFGMIYNHLSHKVEQVEKRIVKPLWGLAAAVACGVAAAILLNVFG